MRDLPFNFHICHHGQENKCHALSLFSSLDWIIYVKEGSELNKTWVCLFTCLTVRAIYLEWVTDLTAVQFLSCLRRFVSRQGKPELIISDNVPIFKLTSTALNKQWKQVLHDKDALQ